MGKASRYSPEVQERSVKLVFEQTEKHESQWAAICSVAEKIGCTPETLRRWVREAERESQKGISLNTDERTRLKQLERENRELRRTNEILKAASAFFAKAEFDRLQR